MPLRTATVELDKDFELDIDLCKAETDDSTGKRYFTGVASGILEDADGERVSKHAIVDMARQAVQGLKLVAGSHQQDWHNEIGDVVRLEHDPEHDELLVKTELPPEGEDPLADKAWLRQTKHGEKLGFSIGGKLQKAFYEHTDTGKRRKVLDKIALRHMALTKKPAYRQSFAEAVAKTFDGDPPADDEFTIEGAHEDATVEKVVVTRELVAKDASSTSQDNASAGFGGEKGKGEPKTSRDVNGPDAEDEDENTDAADLPKATRRLGCPNCGHEFAADLPADTEPPADGDRDTDHEREARKSASEERTDMADIDKSLTDLRNLVNGEDEAEETGKTEPETAAVEKTETGADVTKLERMIAASHGVNQDAAEDIRKAVKDGFELVAKSHKQLIDVIAAMPGGRKSIARLQAGGEAEPTALPERASEVGKTAAEEDSIQKRIEDTDDPQEAMKLMNLRDRGVVSSGIGA